MRPVAPTLLVTLVATGMSCADSPPQAGGTPLAPATACMLAPTGTGDRAHLPVGSTVYLPTGTGWSLVSAPAGNQNAVFTDEGSGRTAFVPHLAGVHRFARAGGQTVTVTAVDPGTLTFHNHNYYPTRAVAVDGTRLWVAGVQRAELYDVRPSDLSVTRTIPVGPWPVAVAPVPAHGQVLVASRADDSLTVVDVATGRPVRSVWIGDEPADVAVTPDGSTAIVVSATDRVAVLLDTATWHVTARIPVGLDPEHIAVAPDGARAYVMGRRTGQDTASPTDDTAGNDITELDLAHRAAARTVYSAGTTLGGAVVSPDGASLYVVGVRNNPTGSLASETSHSFQHTVIQYDLTAATITERRAQDITLSHPAGLTEPTGIPADDTSQPTPSPERPLAERKPVSLTGITVQGSSAWVLSEASDMLVRLDLATLTETDRVETPGRPRSLAVGPDGTAYVYGHQGLTLTSVPTGATPATAHPSAPLAMDPRPADVAAGQRFFTGTGVRSGSFGVAVIPGHTWSCNSCHVDGLGDRIIWQAGPSPFHRNVSRAYNYLEGTYPLGWQGYLSDVRNYAYTVTTNIGIYRPTQTQVDTLTAYLSSIMAPPQANSATDRDGAHSAEACAGATVFTTRCASCHTGPLMTSRARIEHSLGDNDKADIPGLVGTYRLSVWFRKGTSTTLTDAVQSMAAWQGFTLSPTEQSSVVRYLSELTGRTFFVLTPLPRPTDLLPTDRAITLVFSHPVVDSAANRGLITLTDGAHHAVPAMVSVSGRRVTVTPGAALAYNTDYTLTVAPGLMSEQDIPTREADTYVFHTVSQPTLRLDGAYALTVTVPAFGPPGTPPSPPSVITLTATSTPGGRVNVTAHYTTEPYEWQGEGTVSGTTVHVPPIPVTVGPATADGFSGFDGTLTDANGDGVADGVLQGGALHYTLSGPGFEYTDLTWNLQRMP